MDTLREAGMKIRQLRKQHGHSLEELGEKINFNYSNLSKIERGDRKPTLELLESISEFYGVKMAYFFGEEVESPEKLKDDIDWIAFGKEMEKYNLTPDQLEKILEGFLDWKKGEKA